MNKWAIFSLFFSFFMLFIIILANNVQAEISQPVSPPPDDNAAGFLQINDLNQAKSGPLRLGTSDIASPFDYQLEVLGAGAELTNAVIENNLQVWDNINETKHTLIVDSENSRVCIGPCLNIENSKLEVSDSGVIVNNSSGLGRGLSAFSSDAEAIYGSGATGGIYGLASGDNYGVYAVNATGVALEGVNTAVSYSSVGGFSATGYGIYGINSNYLGLWSAYFDGRLESNNDISASKFLSTQPQNSLVPYTSGQIAGSYNIGNSSVRYHDGTYLWVASNGELSKIRASDGLKIFETSDGINAIDVIYDMNYIWAVVEDGDKISKINTITGTEECMTDPITDPSGLVFTGIDYWALSAGSGELIKINGSDCSQIGLPISLVNPSDFTLGKIIFDGSYLWALATEEDTEAGAVISINPSSEEAMMWKGLVGNNPADIYFDNSYYWVSSPSYGTLTRFYLRDNICSELDTNDNYISCLDDSQCSGVGGTCSFSFPQRYGNFSMPAETIDEVHISNNPREMVSDGTYLWINNIWLDINSDPHYELVKMSMADPEQVEGYGYTLTPTGLVYDGTYLWVSSSDADLTKIYSGSGYGLTDLSNTLALQNNSPLVVQNGSMDIQGSGQFGNNITASGDLISLNNVWGNGAETIGDGVNPLGQGIHPCLTDGYFITNITVNVGGEVTQIKCRQL